MRQKLLSCLILSLLAPIAPAAPATPLQAAFIDPPDSARPRAWWHWMDGNVSESGIVQDLQWMKRAGLGGLQQFDASLHTQQVVKDRVVYGSPMWQASLRRAATEADRLGLEMAVASSPGWSLTGGPWVRPEQAMKKLVWSELTVAGGTASPTLRPPPATSGPFLDVPAGDHGTAATWYRDIAVLAVPAEPPAPAPQRAISRAGADVAAVLTDGRLGEPVQLALGDDGATWVTFDYGAAQRFEALSVTIPAKRGFGAPPLPAVTLQASDDGEHYTDVAQVPLSTAPRQTVAFAAQAARYWRVLLKADGKGGPPPAAPGVVLPPFGKPADSFPLSEVTLHAHARVHRVEEKAGFAAARNYYAIDTPAGAAGIAAKDVLDVTDRLRADGRLDWTAPPGRWTLLRFGYSLTGQQNAPAPEEATGLEVDKLNGAHVQHYMDTYLNQLRGAVGPGLLGRRGIGALLNDSIEAGAQNWTDGFEATFAARRGYSLLRWLPAVTGRIVDDAAASDRFLYDLRRTIADQYADGHYATIARSAHAQGMIVYGEALEDNRPQLGDDLDMRRYADVPMAAMWTVPADGQPRPSFIADIQGAASVAHVWGRNLVAAESLTAFGQPWGFAPRDLKRTADIEFALGVNRLVIHTSPHQPLDGVTPGTSLAPFLGQYFSRYETWAEQARPWIDYLARTSHLLQHGRHVADIAYFPGEEAPITGLFGAQPNSDIPAGYGFDYVNLTALQQQVSVQDGQLVSRSGARYRVLYLGGASTRLTVAALQRIAALAQAGALVVGRRPDSSPSQADSPVAFKRLVTRLWGPADGAPDIRRVGRGSVDGGGDLPAALARHAIAPALKLDGATPDVMALQRHSTTHELYFIANTGSQERHIAASFRDGRGAAEIWHPDSACIARAPTPAGSGSGAVPLTLAPQQSLFVVYPRKGATPGAHRASAEPAPWRMLDGPWQLVFPAGRGAPAAPLELDALRSWNTSDIDGVRHFSGTATYRQTFHLDQVPSGAVLDLGEVRDLASVTLNDRQLGTAWKPPYRFDLASALRAGDNTLEVAVTNLWVNRLVGDARPDTASVTGMRGVYTADAPLRESGMTGPVQVLVAQPDTCVPGLAR